MLYIVATPIGNMNEITPRAVDVLKNVSLIAAEDTRRCGMLLRHFGIQTPMVQYQRFNERASAPALIERLRCGEDVALVSDAGMPLISDPGSILIDECIKGGIEFTAVSGACALINALVLSGLDTASFCMLGYLPDKVKLREEKIKDFVNCPATLIFYSPPQSVVKDLEFLFAKLGDRRVSVARELTKKFEQVVRGTLGNIAEIKQRGEFVIVVEGFKGRSGEGEGLSATELVELYQNQGFLKMDAIKKAAKELGIKKSDLYDMINKF